MSDGVADKPDAVKLMARIDRLCNMHEEADRQVHAVVVGRRQYDALARYWRDNERPASAPQGTQSARRVGEDLVGTRFIVDHAWSGVAVAVTEPEGGYDDGE